MPGLVDALRHIVDPRRTQATGWRCIGFRVESQNGKRSLIGTRLGRWKDHDRSSRRLPILVVCSSPGLRKVAMAFRDQVDKGIVVELEDGGA